MNSAVHIENTPPGPRAQPPRDQIEGWGADLDRANRPAEPMERTPPRLDSVPTLIPQLPRVEVLRSTERPGLTPVFGSTVPPAGLSGALRRKAFQYSENDLRHWLILLFADRVDVGEGLVEDLAHGHVPNLYREMGGRAEFRHNRAGAIRKVAVATTLTALAVYLLRPRRH